VVGPNEAAVIIRDGEIESTLTGTRSNTSGLWDNFKKLWGRSSDLQVIYVDTAPIDLTFYIGKGSRQETGTETGRLSESREDAYKTIEDRTRTRVDKTDLTISALTNDGQHVSAEISLTLHVLTNDAQLLTTLLRGGTAIADWDIAALVKDELLAKAFVPVIGQHAGSEIRGNQVLLTQISQSAESLLADKFELFGLELINMYVNWGLTDEDELVIEQGRKEREEKGIEFDHTRKIREQERELELDKLRASNLIDVRKLNAEGDAEEAELILASEINRENLIDGNRVDQEKITAAVKEIELGIAQKEDQLRIDAEKSQADIRFAIEQRQALFDQDLKRRSEEGRQQTLDTESQRRMSEMQGLSAMHRQKQADRRASEHDTLQTQLDASLKQSELEQRTVRDTMLSAGSADPTVLRELLSQGTDRVLQNKRGSGVEDRAEKVVPEGGAPTRSGPTCKSCSSAIEIGWKVCPTCAIPIELHCRNCSVQLEEGWNNCPSCGLSINA
jgi:hypothetical protein